MSDPVKHTRAHLESQLAKFAEARAVLTLVEWSDGRQAVGPDDWRCPVCQASQRHGHAADCRLAKALDET